MALSEMTSTQLLAVHNLLLLEAHAARAAGDRDETYRLAQKVRQSTAEMRLRLMTRQAA